jgi:redox-sensitive bicupin YhaK (pirin superfamily)
MKQIAETDRKFIDMIDLKVHHSIFPVKFPPTDTEWGNIFRFDDKIILPGRQDIQNFTGSPILMVIILISGAAAYYDSTGYRKVLKENDTLLASYGNDGVQTIIFNFNENEENEFLEILLTTDSTERRRQFFPARVSEVDEAKLSFSIPSLNDDSIDLNTDSWLWRGRFVGDSDHVIDQTSLNDNLILFVLSGSMTVNSRPMTYRDGMSLSLKEKITIHFEKETDLLIIQLPDNLNDSVK